MIIPLVSLPLFIYFLSLIFFLYGVKKKLNHRPPESSNLNCSVILCVRNGENSISEILTDFENQIFEGEHEFIIVDDCSADNAIQIINNFKSKKIKKYFLKKHIGRTPALNYGLKKCKGKYIAILDSDDISSKNRLLKQVNFLDKNLRSNIVGSKTILIDQHGKKLKPHGANHQMRF